MQLICTLKSCQYSSFCTWNPSDKVFCEIITEADYEQ